MIVLDVESSGLDYKRDEFRVGCFSVYTLDSEDKFLLLRNFVFYSPDDFLNNLALYCSDGIVGHNILAFDFPLLFHQCRQGTVDNFMKAISDSRPMIYDTLAISRLYSSGEYKHSLGHLAVKFGFRDKVEIEDFANVSLIKLAERCKVDVDITFKVWEVLYSQCISKDPYYKYHNDYYLMVLEMLYHGVPVNILLINREKTKIISELSTKMRKFVRQYGKCNLRSPKQKLKLAEKYGVADRLPRTLKGSPSFQKENRKYIKSLHPCFENMFEIVDAKDIVSNYFSGKKNSMLDTRNGRIYCVHECHKQRGLRTSTRYPALMNMPHKLRHICSTEGIGWVGYDIKALEVNVLAVRLDEVCGDSTLRDFLSGGGDFKAELALDLGTLMDNINPDERLGVAKALFFQLVYGGGPNALARRLKLPQSYGQEIRQQLVELVPGLNELIAHFEEERNEYGCIYNYYGYSIKPSKDYGLLNGDIQSTGSNYCNFVLGRVNRFLRQVPIYPVLHIHDESQQIFNLSEISIEDAKNLVNRALDKAFTSLEAEGMYIFSKANVDVGHSWATSH